MKQHCPMIRLSTGLYSKNAHVRSPPMTSKSSRRGPHCRLYGPSSNPIKTRGIRHHPNYPHSFPTYKHLNLPVHNLSPLGNSNGQLNLPTTNRPKINNRLLIHQPHKPHYLRNTHPNPMGPKRGNFPYSRAWFNILPIILPSQHQLRTNALPNTSTDTRTTHHLTPDNILMTYRKPC